MGDKDWGGGGGGVGEQGLLQGFPLGFGNFTDGCFISPELWFRVGDALSLLSVGSQMFLLGSWCI